MRGHRDSFAFAYRFRCGDVLGPGQTIRSHPGSRRRNRALDRYLGRGRYVLADGGGAVSLRTYSDVVVDCASWRRDRC